MKAQKLSPPPKLPVSIGFDVVLFNIELLVCWIIKLLSTFLFFLTGVLRGVFGVVLLTLRFVLLSREHFVVADDEVDEAGDIDLSSFDLSLPRGLRPLLLLRELVRRLLTSQSSSYSASVLRLFLRFLKLRSSSSSSSN